MPWYKFLLPIGLNTVFKFLYVFPEKDPYGIKNEFVRKKVSATLEGNTAALDCIPMVCVLELLRLSKHVRKEMKKLTVPLILFHSVEDDLTSLKSADIVYDNASSEVKEFIKLENSYHIITLDNDRDLVSNQTIEFFEKISASGSDNAKIKNIMA